MKIVPHKDTNGVVAPDLFDVWLGEVHLYGPFSLALCESFKKSREFAKKASPGKDMGR